MTYANRVENVLLARGDSDSLWTRVELSGPSSEEIRIDSTVNKNRE